MTLNELHETMTPEEFALWVAFYNYEAEEHKKASKSKR